MKDVTEMLITLPGTQAVMSISIILHVIYAQRDGHNQKKVMTRYL